MREIPNKDRKSVEASNPLPSSFIVWKGNKQVPLNGTYAATYYCFEFFTYII